MRGIAGLASSRGEVRSINDSDVPWISRDRSGTTYVDERSALNFSAVWACETLIADSIATLPADTYRKTPEGRVETTAPRWVEYPNVENNRVDYETQRLLSLLGWGNAWSMLSRKGGHIDFLAPVEERWIIEPWRVQVRRVPGALPATFVDGVYYPPELIQHVKGYTLPGALTGMSVIEHARQSLAVGMNAESFGAKFFENGVTPSGILEIPQLPAEINKDVVDRLREQFASRYAGTGNAHKPVALTGGTTWRQITINPADAQFLETRQFQIEEVSRWFRVPPHEIQRISNMASQGGGNGLETQSLMLAQRTLLPWTIRLEQADSALLPRGQYLRLNLNAFVRADIKTRHEVYSIRRNIGMSNADELRALEDERPIGGRAGTTYWMPVNQADAGAEPVSTPAGQAPTAPDQMDVTP